jgi:leucyl aminopeptidase (aminopeptidase T)
MLPSYPEPVRRAFARNLLRNALRLSRGENLLIETWSETLPWAVSLSLEARVLGARPLLSLHDEPGFWRSQSEVPAGQLGRVGDHEWAALRSSSAYVYLYGPMDTVREEALPAEAARRIASNHHELMRLVEKYRVRMVRWDLGRTSPTWARRYGVDLGAWRRELIDAASVDPRSMQRAGQRVGDRLRRGREAVITHPNGTSLTLRLAHRSPKLDDGMIDEHDVRAGNLILVVPSGVVATTVAETFAEGTFVSTGTGALWIREQEGHLPPGTWTFRGGALAGFDLTGDGAPLRRELSRLGHPKLRPGLVSVGLNPRTSTIPLLFDQELGTITLEIGRNVQLGGRNRSPHVAAWVPLRGGTLEIDGQLVVHGGRIVGGL